MRAQRAREVIDLAGNVVIEVREAASGRLLSIQRTHNLIPLVYRNALRDAINNAGNAVGATQFAVGTGSTPPASGDTALVAEVARDVVTKRAAEPGKVSLQYFLPSTVANGATLQEAGVFTEAGLLVARVTHLPIIKTTSITVTYSWELSINAG